MNVLEAAVMFVPSLTKLMVTIYDGRAESLDSFEKQYCFSPDIQQAFTARGLMALLKMKSEEFIYEIVELMGVHLIVFQVQKQWVMLGPYVESEWDENRAKGLLAKHGGSVMDIFPYKMYYCQFPVFQQNYVVKIASLILENMGDGENIREVRVIYPYREQGNPRLVIQDTYGEMNIVNKRYETDRCFIHAISNGDTKEALKFFHEIKKMLVGLRFISENMRDQIVSAAIIRTMVRTGAERAGLTPVLIDYISQEYAQKMQHTVSIKKLDQLEEQLIIHFCIVIREERENQYSKHIKKAVQYIDINISRNITISDLSEVAGISPNYLVRLFQQETGMRIKQYIAKKRCRIAAELLVDSELSIQEISSYVGYEDNNYFTKVFKVCEGITPQDYRRAGAFK